MNEKEYFETNGVLITRKRKIHKFNKGMEIMSMFVLHDF